MPLPINLDLASSSLLRASLDEHFFRIWDFACDGEFPHHREQKMEFDGWVDRILETTPPAELRALARQDRSLRQGSTFRGFEPFDPDTGDLSVIAIRQLELAVYSAENRLVDAAYSPASKQDRVCQVVHGLFEQLTARDRLLRLTPEMVRGRRGFSDRVFCVGDYGIFPHPALRPARELVHDLCALAEAGAEVQVAIDPHSVVPRSEIADVGLFDYWFGLKLDIDRLDDPTAIGCTVHGRRPEAQNGYTFPLLRTEFRWRAEGPLKTLEVQETVPRDRAWGDHGGRVHRGSRYVANRYLHSIRDTDRRRFIHLDGAAKAFPREQYGPTVEQPDLPQGEPVYRKLFRLDGHISEEDWGRLVAHFFRGNELVIEYFGDVLDERGGTQEQAA